MIAGLWYYNVWWLLNNPDTLNLHLDDTNIIVQVHAYEPWTFCGNSPTQNWFDADWLNSMYDRLRTWQTTHGQIPVYVGETGVTHDQADGVRYAYYKAVATACDQRNIPLAVWEDNGWYDIYDSAKRTFETGVMDALGLGAAGCTMMPGKNLNGEGLSATPDYTSSADACCQRCRANNACKGFTYVPGNNQCWLKSVFGVSDAAVISGII